MTILTEVFPCFFLSCKANARVKPRKDGARPALFIVVVLLYVFFVLFYVFLCSMYCLFCDVLCIVCVYMCTEQLPPGGHSIAVKYIISYHIISYHIISYHIISYHIISYHISYHIISYHIISYHIISYHIISSSKDLLKGILLFASHLRQAFS